MEAFRIRTADRHCHAAYFQFVNAIFHGSREETWTLWRDRGGWGEDYEVFALRDRGRIVSTIGRSRMRLVVDGKVRTGFQLGAVATAAPYRGQGLARHLMHQVIGEGDAPIILFANRSAVQFYPRFGFTRVPQRRSTVAAVIEPSGRPASRCDLANPAERARLADLCARARPIRGRLTAQDYYWILLWNLSCGPAAGYWLDDHDALVAATMAEDRLVLHDAIAPWPFDLQGVVSRLINSPVGGVEFLFDPEDWWPAVEHPPYDDADSVLFAFGGATGMGGPVQFPELAHT